MDLVLGRWRQEEEVFKAFPQLYMSRNQTGLHDRLPQNQNRTTHKVKQSYSEKLGRKEKNELNICLAIHMVWS